MDLLEGLRNGAVLSRRQQTKLILQLSWPAIMGQLSIIAMQYIDDNIRCNCICPGAMATPTGISANKIGNVYTNQPRVRMIERVADPMEMANVACFLLSDEASYMTGTEVKVDGGSMACSVKIPPRVEE